MYRKLPREVHIQYVKDWRGGTHNVLEVCSKDTGVRYVMAQDSETSKERDKYKLRASLLEEKLEREREYETLYAGMRGHYVRLVDCAINVVAAMDKEPSLYSHEEWEAAIRLLRLPLYQLKAALKGGQDG